MDAEHPEQRGPSVKPARKPAKRKQLVSVRHGAVALAEDLADKPSLLDSRAAVNRPSKDNTQRGSVTHPGHAESRFSHSFGRVPTNTAARQRELLVDRRPVAGLPDDCTAAGLIASPSVSAPRLSRYVSPETGVPTRTDRPSYTRYDDATLYGPSMQPSPEHVQQGRMGNCWFLAALAALASTARGRAHIIDHIRPNMDETSGQSSLTYTVTLYAGMGGSGSARHYRMRPAFPAGYASPTPPDRSAASGGPGAAAGPIVWVALYERALAHQRGDYAALSGRSGVRAYWAMRVLTGESSDEVEITQGIGEGALIDIWQSIWVSVHRYNDPVVVATRSGVHRISSYRSGHAYGVQRAFTRGGDRFIRIYNPHGERSRGGTPWQDVPLGDLGRFFATVTLGTLQTGTGQRIRDYIGW